MRNQLQKDKKIRVGLLCAFTCLVTANVGIMIWLLQQGIMTNDQWSDDTKANLSYGVTTATLLAGVGIYKCVKQTRKADLHGLDQEIAEADIEATGRSFGAE